MKNSFNYSGILSLMFESHRRVCVMHPRTPVDLKSTTLEAIDSSKVSTKASILFATMSQLISSYFKTLAEVHSRGHSISPGVAHRVDQNFSRIQFSSRHILVSLKMII